MGSRDQAVDVLRGWAIVMMVWANLSSLILAHPHPLPLRILGSFAAPLFITLSGMMVAFTTDTKRYTARHFWTRGAFILLCGAFIDVAVWHLIPGVSVDVLYLIGISLPIAFHYQRLPGWAQGLVMAAVFLAAPILRMRFGYTDYPTETYIWGEVATSGENPTGVIAHWLIDGWFPLFPWLGFSFLGVILGRWRWRGGGMSAFRPRPFLWISIAAFIAGAAIWRLYPAPMLIRDIWSDIFYPPTLGYTAIAMGVVILFLMLADSTAGSPLHRPLSVMGRCSLALYISHYAIGWHIIHRLWPDQGLAGFFALYAILIAALLLIAICIAALKRVWRAQPAPIRLLLGG